MKRKQIQTVKKSNKKRKLRKQKYDIVSVFTACLSGNAKLLKSLPTEFDINYFDFRLNKTLLMIACENNDAECVKALLSHPNIDPNYTNNKPPILLLCEKGSPDLKALKEILDHRKIHANKSDSDGKTVISVCALRKYQSAYEMLLDCEKIDLNCYYNNKKTLLFILFEQGMKQQVGMLLQRERVNPNIGFQSNDGLISPLHQMPLKSATNLYSLLLQHQKCNANLQNDEGYTALHLACKMVSFEMISSLLQSDKTDPNILDNYNNSAIHYVLYGYNFLKILVLFLANKRFDLRLLVSGKGGEHILGNKAVFESKHIFESILNRYKKYKDSILMEQLVFYMCKYRMTDYITDTFIDKYKIKFVHKDEKGRSCLFYFCQQDNLNFIQKLLQTEHFDVNERDQNNQSTFAAYLSYGCIDDKKTKKYFQEKCLVNQHIVSLFLQRDDLDVNQYLGVRIATDMVNCKTEHIQDLSVLSFMTLYSFDIKIIRKLLDHPKMDVMADKDSLNSFMNIAMANDRDEIIKLVFAHKTFDPTATYPWMLCEDRLFSITDFIFVNEKLSLKYILEDDRIPADLHQKSIPILFMMRNKNPDFLSYILKQKKFHIDVNETYKSTTYMFVLIEDQKIDMINILLDREELDCNKLAGVDHCTILSRFLCRCTTPKGRTEYDIIDKLLKRMDPSLINYLDKTGNATIHHCIIHSHVYLSTVLRAPNINIHLQNIKMQTPFMLAFGNKIYGSCMELLKKNRKVIQSSITFLPRIIRTLFIDERRHNLLNEILYSCAALRIECDEKEKCIDETITVLCNSIISAEEVINITDFHKIIKKLYQVSHFYLNPYIKAFVKRVFSKTDDYALRDYIRENIINDNLSGFDRKKLLLLVQSYFYNHNYYINVSKYDSVFIKIVEKKTN